MNFKIFLFLASISLTSFYCNKDANVGNTDNNSNNGKGGSLARFTTSGDYMYIVDAEKLLAYNISNPADPQLSKTSDIGFNIETIFPYKDKLFIGSRDAMYIYSIANPANPVKLGEVSHIRACDPVVANDDVAYVTVRNGSSCGGSINALYVYDITNPQQPQEMNTLMMSNPHGLGLNDSILYVCDSNDGLKIFRAGDNGNKYALTYLNSKSGYNFKDCIVYDNLLLCMVEGGVVLYNIQDPINPVELSKIAG